MLNRDWRSHLKKRAISVTLSKNILALFSGGVSSAPVPHTACVGENSHAAECQVILVGYMVCSAKPNIPYTPPGDVTPTDSGWDSAGVTCCTHRVRRGTPARCRVPKLCSGVSCCFDFVETTRHPTRMGSMREPGSRTHPQVTPTESGWGVQRGFAALHTPPAHEARWLMAYCNEHYTRTSPERLPYK
jgi:hypothetical protein